MLLSRLQHSQVWQGGHRAPSCTLVTRALWSDAWWTHTQSASLFSAHRTECKSDVTWDTLVVANILFA
eukprot:4059444-Amphidinium_carterae.1